VVINSVSLVEAAVETPAKDLFRVNLDSHADTCCDGIGVLIVNQMAQTVRVTLFLKSLGSVHNVPIVTESDRIQQSSGRIGNNLAGSSSSTFAREELLSI
jgi:hypothetical protein